MTAAPTPSNARLIAELQAVSIGIQLVGLDRLPEVMRPVIDDASAHSLGTQRSGVNQDSTHPAKPASTNTEGA